MKFCKDCKWFAKPGQEFEFATWGWAVHSDGSSCYNPKAVDRDMVYGDRSPSLPAAMRDDKLLCGPTAKWFEEKEKPIPKCEECRWNHPIGDHIPGLCERSTYCEYTVCVRGIETKCGKYGKWWEKKEVRSNDDYLDAFDSKPVRIEKALKPKKQSWLCRLICGGKK
jgi:hypothetical protein